MASKGRTTASPVVNDLLANAPLYEFFQAVRLLQVELGETGEIGDNLTPREEGLRFRPRCSLGFPAGDIHEIVWQKSVGNRPRYQMEVNFLGLYGSASPLPAFDTEELFHFDSDLEISPRRAFLDLFNHRAISLFYRAWGKYRDYAQCRPGHLDELARNYFAFTGLYDEHSRANEDVDWSKLLAYSGILAVRGRSARGLEKLICHSIGIEPVHIEERILRHIDILPEQQVRLGMSACTLGEECYLGARAADVSGKFRIVLGPLQQEQFLRLMPGKRDFCGVVKLTQLYLRDPLEFDIKLRIEAGEVPATKLNDELGLGWATWLGGASGHADEVILPV